MLQSELCRRIRVGSLVGYKIYQGWFAKMPETLTFVGFDESDTETVAVFRNKFGPADESPRITFTREKLRERSRDMHLKGLSQEETAKAIKKWPTTT